jgi:alanine-synthesizing transaminase
MAFSAGEFYRVSKLPPYVFAVVNEMKARLQAEGHDVIDMGMGNPDGASPKAVVARLNREAKLVANHRYSQSKGIEDLRLEICKRYETKYGVTLDPDREAIVTIGAKEAVSHLLLAVIAPGDVVVAPNPAYPIHQYGTVLAEGQSCAVPMPTPDEFLNRLRDMYAGGQKPAMVLISFPHNPTGQVVDLDYLKEIVELAREHGTMVVHDFAYADLAFDGFAPPSILQVPGAKEVAVEIYSMSKSFNMAGWRVGFCVGNPKMVAALTRIKSYLDYGTFQPIQIASVTALRECEVETAKIREVYRKRRDVLCEGLTKAGWPVEKPKGAMFVWAAIPERFREMSSLDFSKMVLQEAKVALSPGIGFGPHGEGFVRFALIESEARTRRAVGAIKTLLKR